MKAFVELTLFNPAAETVSDHLGRHGGRQMSQQPHVVDFSLLSLLKLHAGIPFLFALFALISLKCLKENAWYTISSLQAISLSSPSRRPQVLSHIPVSGHGFYHVFISLFLSFFLCPAPSTTGFGGCVDLIVDGVSLLNKIGLPATHQPLHHNYIENEVQLAQSFAYFFAPGAAAE